MNESLTCLLLALLENNILLPSAAVAEITYYEKPALPLDAPIWLQGILTWRGIPIPLVNIEKMESHTVWDSLKQDVDIKVNELYRIVILNRIYKIPDTEDKSKDIKYPFFAIFIKQNPRIYRVSPNDIQLASENPITDFRFVGDIKLHDTHALIPNLRNIWKMIDALPPKATRV